MSEDELSDSPVLDLIVRLEEIHTHVPKPGQLKAVQCLLDGHDVVFSAKTGYGKSMILYSASALNPRGISLLIYPLNALEADQIHTIRKLKAKVNPCILNGETMTKQLLDEIKQGKYTHILTSPELALSNKSFREVLQTSIFRDRLILIAIDEAHLAHDWSSWRGEYGRLGELRSILPLNVPLITTSATLGDELTRKLVDQLRMNQQVKIIKESVDRDDIFFNVQYMHAASASNYEDLRFLVADVNKPLKKVIIYGDTIRNLIHLRSTLVKFHIKARGDQNRAKREIRCYNSLISPSEKARIYEDFVKTDSSIKILCSTDAMGLGMNIIDVNIVIQWKVPPSFRALMQRAGRAARGSGRLGEFIWFYPRWCKGPRTSSSVEGPSVSQLRRVTTANDMTEASSSETDTGMNDEARKNREREKRKAKKTFIQQRTDMENSLWRLINEDKKENCIRKIILTTLNEPNMINYSSRVYPIGCCSDCDSNGWSIPEIALHQKPRPRRVNDKTPIRVRTAVETALKKWRDEKGSQEFSGSILVQGNDYSLFLDDDIIKDITKNVHSMNIAEELPSRLAEWPPFWQDKHTNELVKVIEEAVKDEDQIVHENESSARNSNQGQPLQENESTDSPSVPVLESHLDKPVSMNPSELRVTRDMRTPRKRPLPASIDYGSPLQTRNISPFRRDEILRMERSHDSESEPSRSGVRSRRNSAIIADAMRKANLDSL